MNERALRAEAGRWLEGGIAAVVVTVVHAAGSVPRGVGTRMLVSATASAGTVGGGHLEWRALATAREGLARRPAGGAGSPPTPADRPPAALDLPLGPALGQCCGGRVTLDFRWLDADSLAQWPVPPPLFHLQLYGAGHVGRAIAKALEPLAVVVDWIDEREAEFPPEGGPPHIRRLAVDAVESEVRQAPANAFYLVLTHSHDLDLRLADAVLRRGDFGFFGLIGSATKRARFERRLAERGIAPEALARLICPIGWSAIPGKEPEVLAVAVVAQLLQVTATRSPAMDSPHPGAFKPPERARRRGSGG